MSLQSSCLPIGGNSLETDDTVLFVRRKGGVRIGLVTETFREQEDSDSEEEEEDESEEEDKKDSKLTIGQSRVEWFPSGKDGCVREEKAILLDRSLLVGEIVSRRSEPSFIGFVKRVNVTADAVLLPNKEWVVRGLDGSQLTFVHEYDEEASTCSLLLGNWVGSLESSDERLMLRSKKHGYLCWMSSKHEDDIWDLTWKREQYCSFDNTQWYPGQTVKLTCSALKHAQWIGTAPPERFLKRIATGSTKMLRFVVEKTELTALNVRWLAAVAESGKSVMSSGYLPPSSKVEGEDLAKIRKLDHFEYQLTQIGDRVWLDATDENIRQVVRYDKWLKVIEKDFAGPLSSSSASKKTGSSSQKSRKQSSDNVSNSSSAVRSDGKDVHSTTLLNKTNNHSNQNIPKKTSSSSQNSQTKLVDSVGLAAGGGSLPSGGEVDSELIGTVSSGDEMEEDYHADSSSSTSSSSSSATTSLAASQTTVQRARRRLGYLARRWTRAGAAARSSGVRLRSGKVASPSAGAGGVNGPAGGGRDRRRPLNKPKETDMKGFPVVGQRIAAEVIFSQSFLDIVWQDGSEEKGIPSRDLAYFHIDLDDHAFVPGNFVQFLNDPPPCTHGTTNDGETPGFPADHPGCTCDTSKDKLRWPTNGFGIVDKVDASDRTASVCWFELIGQVEATPAAVVAMETSAGEWMDDGPKENALVNIDSSPGKTEVVEVDEMHDGITGCPTEQPAGVETVDLLVAVENLNNVINSPAPVMEQQEKMDFTLRFVPTRLSFGPTNGDEYNDGKDTAGTGDATTQPAFTQETSHVPAFIAACVSGDVSVYDLKMHSEMNFYPSLLVMRIGGYDVSSLPEPTAADGDLQTFRTPLPAYDSAPSSGASHCCSDKHSLDETTDVLLDHDGSNVATPAEPAAMTSNPWVGVVLGVDSQSGMVEVRWVSGLVDRVPPSDIIPVFRDDDGEWSEFDGGEEGEEGAGKDSESGESNEGDDDCCQCRWKKKLNHISTTTTDPAGSAVDGAVEADHQADYSGSSIDDKYAQCDYCKSHSSWETLSQEDCDDGSDVYEDGNEAIIVVAEGEGGVASSDTGCNNNNNNNSNNCSSDEVFHDAVSPPPPLRMFEKLDLRLAPADRIAQVESLIAGVEYSDAGLSTTNPNVAVASLCFAAKIPVYMNALRQMRPGGGNTISSKVMAGDREIERKAILPEQLRYQLLRDLVDQRPMMSKLFQRSVVFKHIRIAQVAIRRSMHALRNWLAVIQTTKPPCGFDLPPISESSPFDSLESLLEGCTSAPADGLLLPDDEETLSAADRTDRNLVDFEQLLVNVAGMASQFILTAPGRPAMPRVMGEKDSKTSMGSTNINTPSLEKDSFCDAAWRDALEHGGLLCGECSSSRSSSQDSLAVVGDGLEDVDLHNGVRNGSVGNENERPTVIAEGDTLEVSNPAEGTNNCEKVLPPAGNKPKRSTKISLTDMFISSLTAVCDRPTAPGGSELPMRQAIDHRTHCLMVREALLGKTAMLGDFVFVLFFFKTMNRPGETSCSPPGDILEKLNGLPEGVISPFSKALIAHLMDFWQLRLWGQRDLKFWGSLFQTLESNVATKDIKYMWEGEPSAEALAIVDFLLLKTVYLLSYIVDQIAIENLVCEVFSKVSKTHGIVPDPADSPAQYSLFQAEAAGQLTNAVRSLATHHAGTPVDQTSSLAGRTTPVKASPEADLLAAEKPVASKASDSPVPMELTEDHSLTAKNNDGFLGSFDLMETVPDNHHFLLKHTTGTNNVLSGSDGFSKEFLRAVRKEIDIMSTSLPGGVFVKGFENRMDLFSAMLVGPEDTPFSGGLFYFDIQLPASYPNEPPTVFYRTFSSEQMNPNLYQDGKVCVSLLGTWSGKDTEMWNPGSNLLQVLVSIQGLILNAEPYFNEAGYEARRCLPESVEKSRRYNEMALLRNIESLSVICKARPSPFELEALTHLQNNGKRILHTVKGWLSGEEECKFRLQPVTKGFVISAKRVVVKFEEALMRVI